MIAATANNGNLVAFYLISIFVLLFDCRIDAEASSLERKLNELTTSQRPLKGDDKSAEGTTATIEVCVCISFYFIIIVIF